MLDLNSLPSDTIEVEVLEGVIFVLKDVPMAALAGDLAWTRVIQERHDARREEIEAKALLARAEAIVSVGFAGWRGVKRGDKNAEPSTSDAIEIVRRMPHAAIRLVSAVVDWASKWAVEQKK